MDEDFESNTEDILTASSSFDIYPNPGQSWIQISDKQQSNQDYQVKVLTLDGKSLITQSFRGRTSLSVHHLDAGLYLIHISNGEKNYSDKLSILR